MGAEKRTASEKAAFKRELTEVVPHLRAFARGLCGRADMADDLVQEALLKAWAAQELCPVTRGPASARVSTSVFSGPRCSEMDARRGS